MAWHANVSSTLQSNPYAEARAPAPFPLISRAVNRLASQRRHSILPFVLAALVLRALTPAGFMPAGDFRFMNALCSTQAPGRVESSLPAGKPAAHCEYCVAPLAGGTPAFNPAVVAQAAVFIDAPVSVAPVVAVTPAHVPGARAPPA